MKILKEDGILSWPNFNINEVVPTEEDFKVVAAKLKDYTKNGKACNYTSNPKIFVNSIRYRADAVEILRYYFAAVLLHFDELATELKEILKTRHSITKDDMQKISGFVVQASNRWTALKDKYTDPNVKEIDDLITPQNVAGQNGNYVIPAGLNLTVNAKPGEPYYKLVSYNPAYNPPARQYLIIRKKVGNQYTVAVHGTPRTAPRNLDPVFNSIQQAINFAANAGNIPSKRDASKFIYRVKPGLDKDNPKDLSDYELVNTICGAAYMDKTCQYKESLNEDVEKHDELNPKLWEDNKLKSEVKEKIDLIVNEFLEGLKEDEISIAVKDVVLIGSNCSYNYTKDSDLDVHIIAEHIDAPENLYDKIYSAYRSIFSKKLDIEFYGIPVEIYVEVEGMPTVSNGCYSVMNDAWIKEPVAEDIPEIDKEALDKSVKEWEDRYNKIVDNSEEKLEEEKEPEELHEDLEGAKSIIADQVRGEWEAIRNYQKAADDLKDLGDFDDVIDILNSISDEEEVHVGELEKAQSLIDNNLLDNIEDGRNEAEEDLAGKEAPVDESLKESSLTHDSFETDSYYLEYRYNKNNGYEVISGEKLPDGLVSDDFHKYFATEEAAKKYFEKCKKKLSAGETLNEEIHTSQIDEIESFINDIYKLRQKGLQETGEYGVENLTFKEIRNKGYLDNLKDLRNQLIGKELSLESLEQTVPQDLSDNRQPRENEEPEILEEPYSYKDMVAKEQCLSERFDLQQIYQYKQELSRIAHNQAIVQENGLFNIYNVKEDDLAGIMSRIRNLSYIEWVQNSAGRYDFSHPQFMGPQKRYYNIVGKIKEEI